MYNVLNMKKELIEELRRMYEITYKGESIISESFIDTLLNKSKEKLGLKKQDDPSKADLVEPDVQDLYNTLDDAANSGGLNQQKRGKMNYQKEVEALQIALVLLGYDLPRFGVDGLFGSETAAAINKFNNSMLNESAGSLRSTLGSLGYDEKGNEMTSGGEVSNEITDITAKILSDFKSSFPKATVTVTAGNDKYHKNVGYESSHSKGNSIDVALNPYNNRTARHFKRILESYKSKDSNFKYIDEYTNPSAKSTGGHFHLEYMKQNPVKQNTPNQQISSATASPETINKIIQLLKSRQIKSTDIKQYIDPVVNTGGIPELDLSTNEGVTKYTQICDKFLSSYSNPLNITGEMLASSAARAFRRFGAYVPPELALSQLLLEGGINNQDPNSRPIRTRNPFNVGNVDTGSNRTYNNVQNAIDNYYKLIATKYIGKGKTAKDLMRNFVSRRGERYASDTKYENKLASIAQKVSQLA